jgi:hypothetical protein
MSSEPPSPSPVSIAGRPKVVSVDVVPAAFEEPEVACLTCGARFSAMEGRFALKYFRVNEAPQEIGPPGLFRWKVGAAPKDAPAASLGRGEGLQDGSWRGAPPAGFRRGPAAQAQ